MPLPIRPAGPCAGRGVQQDFVEILGLLKDFVGALIEDLCAGMATMETIMNAESKPRTAPSINGHMIILGVGHSIAIYERNREFYGAEFRDDGARLEYAGSWFRFHSGGCGIVTTGAPLSKRPCP